MTLKMRLLLFVVLVGIAAVMQRRALRLGYEDLAAHQFASVTVFLAGGLIAGVFAAFATVLTGVAGRAGFVAFLVLFTFDIAMFFTHQREMDARDR